MLPGVVTEPEATAVYLEAGKPPIVVNTLGSVETQAHLTPAELGRTIVVGSLLVSESDNDELLLFDRLGKELWSGRPAQGFGMMRNKIEFDKGLLCETEEGQLQLLNRDGTLRWLADAYAWSLEPVSSDKRIYVLCWDITPTKIWLNENLPGPLRTRLIKLPGKCLICLSEDGQVEWKHGFENGIQPASAPVFGTDGRVYVLADDGYAYAFEP